MSLSKSREISEVRGSNAPEECTSHRYQGLSLVDADFKDLRRCMVIPSVGRSLESHGLGLVLRLAIGELRYKSKFKTRMISPKLQISSLLPSPCLLCARTTQAWDNAAPDNAMGRSMRLVQAAARQDRVALVQRDADDREPYEACRHNWQCC